MTTDIDRKTSDFEFVSRYSIDTCTNRLGDRHERGSSWALKGRTRTTVSVKKVDANTYQFKLKKIPKNNWLLPLSIASVNGHLRRMDDNRTLVLVKKKIPYVRSIIPSSIVLGVLLGGTIASTQFEPARGLTVVIVTLWIIAALVTGFIAFVFNTMYANHHAQQLIMTLRSAIG